MIEILKNFITLEEITIIKDFYQDHTFERQGNHPDDTSKLQWANSKLENSILQRVLHNKIVDLIGINYTISDGCGVYQRCYIPFGLHTDSKQRVDPNRNISDTESEGKALLIPLDQAPEFNTVFWSVKFKNDQEKLTSFNEFVNLPPDQIKNTKIGNEYDLDFAWADPARKLFNHYDVEGVFNWRIGDAAMWDRNHLHAASDFTKKHPYKDAITFFFE